MGTSYIELGQFFYARVSTKKYECFVPNFRYILPAQRSNSLDAILRKLSMLNYYFITSILKSMVIAGRDIPYEERLIGLKMTNTSTKKIILFAHVVL